MVADRLTGTSDVGAGHLFPEEVLRYLLWHELFHIHLRAGHTPEFRELERAWPSALEGDRFLDTLNEKWCVQYW